MTHFDPGTQRLIDDLLGKPQSFARDELLARARKLAYHDYKSPYATPEGVLVKHLTRAGFPDLAERVLEDRYSQQGTGESQKWAEETPEGSEAEALLAEPGMQEKMREFFAAAKAQEAEGLAFMKRCIRERDFRHAVFSDAKVRDPRKAN